MEKEVGNMLHLVLPNGSNICSYYKKIKYFFKAFYKKQQSSWSYFPHFRFPEATRLSPLSFSQYVYSIIYVGSVFSIYILHPCKTCTDLRHTE